MTCPPNSYIIARLVTKDSSRFSKAINLIDKTQSDFFREVMIKVVVQIMKSDFPIIYAYTQQNEISFLFDNKDELFRSKSKKIISLLVEQASNAYYFNLNERYVFDCNICEMPNEEMVVSYFRWRQAECLKNAIDSYCYWYIRKDGFSKEMATEFISTKSVTEKKQIMLEKGISIDTIPQWQQNGIGFWFEQKQTATKRLVIEQNLDIGFEYDSLIKRLIKCF